MNIQQEKNKQHNSKQLTQSAIAAPLKDTEISQKDSPKQIEESQKWDHSLALQVPVIFDRRFKNSVIHLGQAIKLMSEYFGGSRVWVELGTYIDQKGHLVLDLNIWIKSQMDEEKFNCYLSKVHDLAYETRDKLEQEAIVVEVDGYLECF